MLVALETYFKKTTITLRQALQNSLHHNKSWAFFFLIHTFIGVLNEAKACLASYECTSEKTIVFRDRLPLKSASSEGKKADQALYHLYHKPPVGILILE